MSMNQALPVFDVSCLFDVSVGLVLRVEVVSQDQAEESAVFGFIRPNS